MQKHRCNKKSHKKEVRPPYQYFLWTLLTVMMLFLFVSATANVPPPSLASRSQGSMEEQRIFFNNLWGEPPPTGIVNIVTLPDKGIYSFQSDQIEKALELIENVKHSVNVYCEMCLQQSFPLRGKRGKVDEASVMPGIWLDLDIAGPNHSANNYLPSIEVAFDFLNETWPFRPTIVNFTGGGLHCYWLFHEPWIFQQHAERLLGQSLSRMFQRYIIKVAGERDNKIDNTSDLPRILRVPGTFNYKSGQPVPVRMIAYNPECRYTSGEFIEYLSQHDQPANPAPHITNPQQSGAQTITPVVGDFPPANPALIYDHCSFFKHCIIDAATLTEPEWFCFLSIIGRCIDGEYWSHEISKTYPAYTYQETAAKLQHAISNAGPRTCESIRHDLGGEQYCGSCPFWAHIKSPIRLGDESPMAQARITVAKVLAGVSKDPGLPYLEPNLDALALLAIKDKAAFERAREGLKRAGVAIRRLEQAVRDRASAQNITTGDPAYGVENGFTVYKKPTKDGYIPITLSNFSAQITEEVSRDDGVEVSHFFKIKAILADGKLLPDAEVPAAQFGGMSWVTQKYGADAIIYAGQSLKDHLRVAIQTLSPLIIRRAVFSHTGWRLIGGQWLYLTSAGAIGKDGLVPEIEIDLDVKLKDYGLQPGRHDKRVAIAASLRVRDVAPSHISNPLFISPYLAPLCEVIQVAMSLFIAGPTGTFKTELTAVIQGHYGTGFHGKNLPGNWTATPNSLEGIAFRAKDTLFTIDDFAPGGNRFEVDKMHNIADRVLRGQGNKAGRIRMRSDSSIRPDYYPRGLIVSTGEDVPRGQSLRGRMLILEVSPGDVKLDVLTELQGHATSGVFAESMAGYVQWLAPQIDDLKKMLPQRQKELRQMALAAGTAHTRTPDIIACLMVGLETFCRFALESGAIEKEQASKLWQESWDSLSAAAAQQTHLIESEDPVKRFFELIAAAFTTGMAHITDMKGACPSPQPNRWGWQELHAEDGSKAWKPQGKQIGWVEATDVYLDPNGAFMVAQSIGNTQGVPLSVGQRTLWKRLAEKGFISSNDPNVSTKRMLIGGVRRRILHIKADALGVENIEVPGFLGAQFAQF